MEAEKNITGRNHGLDLIKVICTVLILFHHYQQVLGVKFRYLNFYLGNVPCHLCVEVFFFISGIVTVNYIDRIRNGLGFGAFFGRKYLRLMPLMAISTISCFVFQLFRTGINGGKEILQRAFEALGVALGFQIFFNKDTINNPMWYVSVLLVCYCIFYLICLIPRKTDQIKVNLVFVMTVVAGVIIWILFFDTTFGNISRGLMSFFGGLVFAAATEKKKKTLPGPVWIVILLAGIWLADISYYALDRFIGSFVICPSVIMLSRSRILNRIADSKIMNLLVKASFNTYCWHLFGLMILSTFPLNFNSVWLMLLFAAVMTGLGIVSYYLIERPVSDRLRKFQSKT